MDRAVCIYRRMPFQKLHKIRKILQAAGSVILHEYIYPAVYTYSNPSKSMHRSSLNLLWIFEENAYVMFIMPSILTCPCSLWSDDKILALWMVTANGGSFFYIMNRQHASQRAIRRPTLIVLCIRTVESLYNKIF